MSNKAYDTLKLICTVIYPAVAACVITILKALNVPHVAVISVILAAIETCLGAILGASSVSYYRKKAIDNEDCAEEDDGK